MIHNILTSNNKIIKQHIYSYFAFIKLGFNIYPLNFVILIENY